MIDLNSCVVQYCSMIIYLECLRYCFSTAKGFTKESGILIIKYCQPIRISNASGNVGNQVNGIFDPTDEVMLPLEFQCLLL